MKHIYRSIMLAAVMLGLVACQSDKGIQTTFCKQDKEFAFSEKGEEKLSVKVDVEYVHSGMKAEVKEKVNQMVVGTAFGNKYSGLDVVAAADAYVQDIYQNYKQSNEEYLEDRGDEELDEMSRASFNWDTRVEGTFLSPYDQYLNYLVEAYSFEGGAHGMSFKIPVVLDSKTGEVVTEKDLFVEGYQDTLAKLLTGYLHDSFENEEDYECLFTKDIEPNGSFYLTQKGVVYVYGAYDIGPYYLGIIEVTVPWEEMADILK